MAKGRLIHTFTAILFLSHLCSAQEAKDCKSSMEKENWDSGLPHDSSRITTQSLSLCASKSEWKWTQKYQDQVVLRFKATVDLNSGITDYALKDSGYRDIKVQVYDLPPTSNPTYSGFCRFSPKATTAPCIWMQAHQCQRVREFQKKNADLLLRLNPENIARQFRKEKSSLLNANLQQISSLAHRKSSEGGLLDLFQEDRNYSHYQSSIDKLAKKISDSRLSFSGLSSSTLNDDIIKLIKKTDWNLKDYQEWSQIFSDAGRACDQIKPEYKAYPTPANSSTGGVK